MAECRNIRSLLVIGGARSGKSRYAQERAESAGQTPVLIATAEARDAEMAARIAAHRAARGTRWRVIEEQFHLARRLRHEATPDTILVVDCLTLWLSNLLLDGANLDMESAGLTAAIRDLAGPAIFISNEVGTGIVPDTELGRRFRDAQGRLNQEVAAACDAVVLVVAGLPLTLKPARQAVAGV